MANTIHIYVIIMKPMIIITIIIEVVETVSLVYHHYISLSYCNYVYIYQYYKFRCHHNHML